ncbi:MAG: cupin domain-containing protein [Anaerolineales bacterium]|nr:cupin domain-containing protein [Chloroflexota bacterium]MBL6982021.1 cupin domain-containing protein [Anaerolineales bacterium]
MTNQYSYFENIIDLLPEIPDDSIVSRTFYEDDQLKGILFGFAAGQELSEHTAAKPAILHFIEGQARLTLGDDEKSAGPGTWVHMAPHLPHSVVAESRLVMLLILL